MSKSFYYLLIAVALLVGLLFVPQSFLEKTAYRLFHSSQKIGTVKDVIGRGERTYRGSTQWLSVTSGQDVSAGESFITHADSKILFHFDPPFWLMPYSKVEFLQQNDAIIGHLIYGEIKKLEPNAEAQAITLVFEEKPIASEEFSTAPSPVEAPLVSTDDPSFKALSLNDKVPKDDLQKQIFQTLLLQKKFFQTCFIKHYKKMPTTRGGETVFDLFIQVNGVIERATVTSSDIQDPEYIDCIKIIFKRMRFKNLIIKDPVHATFPLNIETP